MEYFCLQEHQTMDTTPITLKLLETKQTLELLKSMFALELQTHLVHTDIICIHPVSIKSNKDLFLHHAVLMMIAIRM